MDVDVDKSVECNVSWSVGQPVCVACGVRVGVVWAWRVQAVAMVGAHLSILYGEEEHQASFLSVITDAEWGIKLGKLGVSGSFDL